MNDPKLCSIVGCGKPPYGRLAFCSPHYQRYKKYGDPLGGPRGPRANDGEPLAWIISHLDFNSDECLIWPFARFRNGYGSITYRGTSSNASKAMCHEAHGEPPEGKPFALHSCAQGHMGCISPRHVRWGSQAENMQDSVDQGTRPMGSKNGQAKYTEREIIKMRALEGILPLNEIAEIFSTTPEYVRQVHRRTCWKHI